MISTDGWKVYEKLLPKDVILLNFKQSTNFDRSTTLDLTTEQAILPNPCYVPFFIALYLIFL